MVTITTFVLFVIHLVLVVMVRIKKRQFQNLERLNSKQKFILSANNLSLVVFVFQALNLMKYVLIAIEGVNEIFIIGLNYFFNLYPFLLLFFYCREIKFKERRKSTLLRVS